jgi:membrane dipeptidase
MLSYAMFPMCASYDAGVRLLGLHHFADNTAGGSAHGVHRGGLTPWGAALIAAAEARGIVVDLAHSSEAVVRDALRLATKPLLVSHSGAAGRCPGVRTLPDDTLRALGAQGAVVGVGYWREVTCGATVDAIADSILYIARLIGARHVALGSDWDGGVAVPPGLDAGGIAQVTHALRLRGVSADDLAAVMGGNALRVLRAGLEPGEPSK